MILTTDPLQFRYRPVYRLPSGQFRVKNVRGHYQLLSVVDPSAIPYLTKDLPRPQA